MIEWSKVNPRYFEKLIYHALGFEGFRNILWFGRGGGDKGRDVHATSYEKLPFGLGYERKWIFQCKRWKSMPTTGQIFIEYSTAVQHKPDFWVLVIPLEPSASMIDFFNSLEGAYKTKAILLPLVMLEEMLYKYPDLLSILETGSLLVGEEAMNA